MVAKARRRKSFERLLQERKCTGYKHRTTREEERSSKMRAEGEREKERERSVCKLSGYLQRCSSGPIVPQRHKSPLCFPANSPLFPSSVSTSWHTAAHTYTDTASSAIRKHQRGHVPLWANRDHRKAEGQTKRERERERERKNRERERNTDANARRFRFSKISASDPRAKPKDNALAFRQTPETVYGDRGRPEAKSLVERP